MFIQLYEINNVLPFILNHNTRVFIIIIIRLHLNMTRANIIPILSNQIKIGSHEPRENYKKVCGIIKELSPHIVKIITLGPIITPTLAL